MLGIDKLSYQSRWRQVDPMRKLALYGLFLLLAMSCPPLYQALLLGFIAVLTCWLLRVGPVRYLKWLAVPLGFLLVGLVAIVLSVSRQPETLLWSLPLGRFWLGVDPQGLSAANQTFWRSLAALSATFWFVLNTPFPQLIQILQRCRVPQVLTEQILLTWRFIFIFLDEAVAIQRAQSLRFGYTSLGNSYRSLSMLIGMLFMRVMTRYQQMVTSLDIKLYQGDFHL
ncbi:MULTISPECIES: energy-coupling factor ABC transporter transmembrane protein [unclassified Brenneria]|uniref:energy-coupling factor ABC transporter transmembrane protein n=1 Tax=unclassified Brenneria TaxID=2634434 RepID=UPI0015519A4A|nr:MULTISPECIES: energy-coupling factor ABC transporter transmembrane protein [unclassified Brenneria]MBJ7221545.1 energy-coupling factor ABC transporter transmembrane protein [Brenneria sp. L3-3C-1]MEE3642787.1 energy-coupling factor ABC transporter transmembrane protein [Brenneria sp. L3_3C_1]MEE3651031.1 energy-coupling factor ABC transporter transmembrane protein [Brenneria sp. HEZEL_4_2_4]NPD00986.1 energy-coupling factor ABC transporter transmembrane protein [Brenneria sp. hezel4-2-4]